VRVALTQLGDVRRSVGRASFWLKHRIPSYSPTRTSPRFGPSVGEVRRLNHDLQTAVQLVHLTGDGAQEPGEADLRSSSSSSLVGYSGAVTVARFDTYRRRCAASKWSRCRWDTYT